VADQKRLNERFQWQIDISHFTKTFAKKPGVLASSVALAQAPQRLLLIHNKYYIGAEKSFIELVELVKKVGIDKVEAAIEELEKLNLKEVTTDKIVTICQRKVFPAKDKMIDKESQIEKTSREILNLYGKLLNENELILTEVR